MKQLITVSVDIDPNHPDMVDWQGMQLVPVSIEEVVCNEIRSNLESMRYVMMGCIGQSAACQVIIPFADVTSKMKAHSTPVGTFTYQAFAEGAKVCQVVAH